MENKVPTIYQLKNQLGNGHCVRYIDFEKCLYLDLGNGYNIEISGANTTRKNAKVNLFLWQGDSINNCKVVAKLFDVSRTAEAILFAEELMVDTYKESHPEFKI